MYRPEQELRGFARVALEPGASSRVRVELDARAFAYWDTARDRFVVEGGTFGIRVGASSRDLRVEGAVELAGEDLTPPLALDSTVDAFLAHPGAAAWVHGIIAGNAFEAMLFDPQHGAMMRAIPLSRLARFPGSPVSEEDVRQAVARFGGAS